MSKTLTDMLHASISDVETQREEIVVPTIKFAPGVLTVLMEIHNGDEQAVATELAKIAEMLSDEDVLANASSVDMEQLECDDPELYQNITRQLAAADNTTYH